MPAVPLLRRVPESSGDAGDVNVAQVVFYGGGSSLDEVVLT